MIRHVMNLEAVNTYEGERSDHIFRFYILVSSFFTLTYLKKHVSPDSTVKLSFILAIVTF